MVGAFFWWDRMVCRKLRCSDKITHSPVLDKRRRACYYLPKVFTVVNTMERAGNGVTVSESVSDGRETGEEDAG